MSKETVCAVVVTYNRKELLIECLEALLRQTRPVDAIYIIDNASTDGTPELLKEKGFIQELPPKELNKPWEKKFKKDNLAISYVRMNENTGGAGGFYEGVKRAYEKGYDWLWLMDDDGLPNDNALELLVNHIDNKEIQAAISCLVVSNRDPKKLAFSLPILDEKEKIVRINGKKYFKYIKDLKDYCKCKVYPWANFFNGVLISSRAIKDVGFPNKKLFIWGDENDYFFRLKKWGKVITVLNAIHKHPEKLTSNNIPVWKMYYGFRNGLYLNRKYRNFSFLRNLKSIIINFKYFKKNKALNKYFKAIFESYKL